MGSGKKKLKKFEGYIFREDIYIIIYYVGVCYQNVYGEISYPEHSHSKIGSTI